jgi:2-polyprenyl-6-hydroxyphenyl methylase/3-demethylubiquinone-9 3-methyltransferase
VTTVAGAHAQEVGAGERFEFGRNWASFLRVLDSERITEAEKSLREMLRVENLREKSFIDVGSGSGLFSLAARRLGARVHSLDFDPSSVACARELRRRYFPDDPQWFIEEASILDEEHVRALGTFDVVYSWGVLHHTGAMWKAIDHASRLVAPGGLFFIALYNTIPRRSKRWRKIKELYNSGPVMKHALLWPYVGYQTLSNAWYGLKRHGDPLHQFREFKKKRGMSIRHDWIDWIGGLPYESARVDEVFAFCRERGFALENLKTTHGLANNQFVFRR